MRDLFTTIGTRYLIAILNLALIFINAKVLGVEGVGLVGLILAIVGIHLEKRQQKSYHRRRNLCNCSQRFL